VAELRPLFVDSSCLVAIALDEPGASRLRTRIARAPRRFASTLAEAELLAAVTREDASPPANVLDGIAWVAPSRRLGHELARVMASGYTRGADAWHLACALFLDPSASELVFATLDGRQRAVAKALGFRIL
jgi:predicted nucleic acid-binding protein